MGVDFVQAIRDAYEGNILLRPPYGGELAQDFPEELCRILAVSNGIEEMMEHPRTGERMCIGWILYSYEMMCEWSSYYRKEYGVTGTVFADDGADCSYFLKPDGRIVCLDSVDGTETVVAMSLNEYCRSYLKGH